MNRLIASAVALALVVACSQEKQTVDNSQNQTPSEPTGSVVGFVTSLRTGQPLQGVTVTVPTPSGVRTATTDPAGAYSLSGLPAGTTYLIRFSVANHVPGLGRATLPDEAGDFPSNGIAQLNMALAQSNATLNGHVYARDGAPAQGVVLSVDLRDQGFDLVTAATTDAQGAYSLAGLPGAPTGLPIEVVAQPWDADGDGLVDYEALARTAVTYPAATSLLDFDLRLGAADLLLLTSNVESGSIPVGADIQLTFNRALDATVTSLSLYDSTAARTVAVAWTLDATSKILTIAPDGATSLAANHVYSLSVSAVATNGARLNVSRTFTAEASTSLLPPVAGLTVNPQNADYDTATFTLSWTAAAGASGYRVWVHDTSRNPDWLQVASPGSSPTPSAVVTLPSTFDYYSADGIQTPLAFNVGVSFVVVAVNAAGDAPSPTTATPVTRTDTVAPAVLSASQSSSADNTAGAGAKTITLTLTFSEYMDTAVQPTITLPVAGETATFAWNANRTVGVFTITIPAATNGTGNYSVTGAKDTSGNTMAARNGVLTSPVQLVLNGGFESGDLTSWTTSFTGTSTAPVVTNVAAASGTYSAQVGNASGLIQSGTSMVYQTVTLPIGYGSVVASARYRPYTDYPYSLHDTSSCTIQNSTGTTTYATIFSTYSSSTLFSTASVSITAYAGYTIRIACQTYQDGSHVTGMYLDDVSIVATP